MKYDHLRSLVTPHGVVERCSGRTPAPEHGYSVDDASMALVVLQRDADATSDVAPMADACLDFLDAAQRDDGSLVNRRSLRGSWHGDTGFGDHWGRALWAWGTVVGRTGDAERLERAIGAFRRSSAGRSPYLRATAFAALGAAEYLRRFPDNEQALALLAPVRERTLRRGIAGTPWPEPRLAYANGVIPHAMIVAGAQLRDDRALARGLEMLDWLSLLQGRHGYLSPISAIGWAPGDPLPAFEQRPLEVAHLVHAQVAAYDATGDPSWLERARLGGLWFYGVNDAGLWMNDPATGAGYDGLGRTHRDPNCGAAATLAFLSTMQTLEANLVAPAPLAAAG